MTEERREEIRLVEYRDTLEGRALAELLEENDRLVSDLTQANENVVAQSEELRGLRARVADLERTLDIVRRSSAEPPSLLGRRIEVQNDD